MVSSQLRDRDLRKIQLIPPTPQPLRIILSESDIPKVEQLATFASARAKYIDTIWELSLNIETGSASLSSVTPQSGSNIEVISKVSNVDGLTASDANRLSEILAELIDKYAYKDFTI